MAVSFEIQELDSTSLPTTTYTYDGSAGQIRASSIPPSVQTGTTFILRYMSPFLPAGYPATVTADYTPYQIYDSLQAFFSTIAGLLASRAVFVGMGVGSEDASLITTMLLYIAQETIGRVATILFADRFSQRIEADVKFYRFFADIVNDIAFILDCISPNMPILGRAITLCVSNACRALCGVAGGSSKAILSTHFARAGNIGELNAKDGSQETVVSLIGMWAGGLVVSKVEGTAETWSCLIPLLTLHLWCNWQAVKSIRLATLNKQRASILFDGLLNGQIKNLDLVGQEEAILGRHKVLHTFEGSFLSCCNVGASVEELLKCMEQGMIGSLDKAGDSGECLSHLLQIFGEEDYLLWVDIRSKQSAIALKEGASSETQAKGFLHLLQFLRVCKSSSHEERRDTQNRQEITTSSPVGSSDTLNLLTKTLAEINRRWKNIKDQVESVGWDLEKTNLESKAGYRIRTRDGPEGKKEK